MNNLTVLNNTIKMNIFTIVNQEEIQNIQNIQNTQENKTIKLKPYVFNENEYYVIEQTISTDGNIKILKPINLSEKAIEFNNIYYNVIKNNNEYNLVYGIITSIEEIKNYDLSYSKILNYSINDKNNVKKNYCSILHEIYNIIGDGAKIIKNSTMNIKTTMCNNNGFNAIENLGISVQNKDCNNTIIEIIIQTTKNNISLTMEIELNDKKIIFVKIN